MRCFGHIFRAWPIDGNNFLKNIFCIGKKLVVMVLLLLFFFFYMISKENIQRLFNSERTISSKNIFCKFHFIHCKVVRLL